MPHTPFKRLDYLTGRTLSAFSQTYSWVPLLRAETTNPNLGDDGESVGAFSINGLHVTGWARFRWGGSGADGGSGSLRLTPPIMEDRNFHVRDTTNDHANKIAFGQPRNADTPANNYLIVGQFTDDGDPGLRFARSGTNASLSGTGVFDAAAGDALAITMWYVADPDAMHTFLGVGGG